AGNLLGARKAYVAQCRLGVTTDTGDSEGAIVHECAVPALDPAMIESALAPMRGRIWQVPPMYSALKQDGERLYVKARRGEQVQVPAREVDIHRLDLLEHDADMVRLHVECGSGTYVRSLATSLGEALGCGAHVTALRRLWVDPFRQPQMVTLAELEAAAEQGDAALERWLLPVAAGLQDLPQVRLDEADSGAIARGQPIVLASLKAARCAAFASDGALLAVLDVAEDGGTRIVRGFNLPPDELAPALALVETPPASVE
ncbi:MAG: tRNA pseudouridine(55) synthase TruB, partial [Rhodanobacter sp.]